MDFNFYANILESKGLVLGDDYFLQTKEEIENWLNKMKIENYKINDNLTVNVNGNVFIENANLSKIPVQFKIVQGTFQCSKNKLTSLKGSPIRAKNFYCNSNQLTSLEYAPKTVKRDFNCSDNLLTSLKGCPEKVGKSINCKSNPLKSFDIPNVELDSSDFSFDLTNKIHFDGFPKNINYYFNSIDGLMMYSPQASWIPIANNIRNLHEIDKHYTAEHFSKSLRKVLEIYYDMITNKEINENDINTLIEECYEWEIFYFWNDFKKTILKDAETLNIFNKME